MGGCVIKIHKIVFALPFPIFFREGQGATKKIPKKFKSQTNSDILEISLELAFGHILCTIAFANKLSYKVECAFYGRAVV